MNEVLYSSNSEEWSTPREFFEKLNDEFHFNLDPCATDENHVCDNYFTKQEDGISKNWGGCRVFCNPPYGNKIKLWVEKCYRESLKENTIVVMLVPARTDTKWFHDYVYNRAEIRFIKGRLKFGNSKNSAPFPSMVVVFRSAKTHEKGASK